ncbi:MAG: TolC family protein [Rhodospirillales bacterium]
MQGFTPAIRAACCAALFALASFPQSPAGEASADSLAQLVELALRRNPNLLAARQRLAEAQGLLRQAGIRPNPSINVAFASGAPLGSHGERLFEAGYSHVFELGGKRAHRVEVASIQAAAAKLEIANLERQLRADVKSRYIEALAAMRNLGNAQRLLELNRKSYDLATARAREGEGAPLEQGLLQVEVNRIDSDRLLFESQVERAVMELKLLAGMDQEGTLRIVEPLRPPAISVSLERVLEQALAQRPDIQAARLEERLAEAELGLARAEASPDLVATGRYLQTQGQFDQFGFARPGGPLAPLRDTDNLLSAGITISLPIRNRNQGNIEAAVARSRAARLRREALERSVRQEVLAAVNRYQAAQRVLGIFERGVVQQSQENLRIVRSAYDLGELRLLDVIDEQRKLLETQRAYTDLLRDANIAVAELERAVGAPLE